MNFVITELFPCYNSLLVIVLYFAWFTRPGSWNGWQSVSAGWTKISEDGLTVTSTDPIAIPMSKMTPVTIYSGKWLTVVCKFTIHCSKLIPMCLILCIKPIAVGVTQSFYIASTSEFFISSEADTGTAASNSDVSLYTGWGISTKTLFGQPGSTKQRFYGKMIYSLRSDKPSISPSRTPTMLPSVVPSAGPTLSFSPTLLPSMTPSSLPTNAYFPSDLPSTSVNPSSLPSKTPSLHPSSAPTSAPTTAAPTSAPTVLEVPKLVFTIPSSISIQGFGVPQTSAEIATVVAITGPSIAALVQQNLNENQSVTVVILSINGIPVTSGSQSFAGRRLTARRLQGDALDIQYEIILEEICATTDCSDKEPEEIANLVYETVTESMQDEIASGAFATTLEQVAAESGEIFEITVEESNFSDLQVAVLTPGTPPMSPFNSPSVRQPSPKQTTLQPSPIPSFHPSSSQPTAFPSGGLSQMPSLNSPDTLSSTPSVDCPVVLNACLNGGFRAPSTCECLCLSPHCPDAATGQCTDTICPATYHENLFDDQPEPWFKFGASCTSTKKLPSLVPAIYSSKESCCSTEYPHNTYACRLIPAGVFELKYTSKLRLVGMVCPNSKSQRSTAGDIITNSILHTLCNEVTGLTCDDEYQVVVTKFCGEDVDIVKNFSPDSRRLAGVDGDDTVEYTFISQSLNQDDLRGIESLLSSYLQGATTLASFLVTVFSEILARNPPLIENPSTVYYTAGKISFKGLGLYYPVYPEMTCISVSHWFS